MRLLIFLVLFFNINHLYALDFDYEWTNNHPILNEYIEKNRDHILKIAPYKHKRSKKYKKYNQNLKMLDLFCYYKNSKSTDFSVRVLKYTH